MISEVFFVDQTTAEDMVPEPDCAMISITGPNPNAVSNKADLHPDWQEVLRLEFDDVLSRYDHFHPITEEQAAQIIAFLNAVQDKVDKVVVHCLAGVSRSAGVAKFVAERYGLVFDHTYEPYNGLVYDTLNEVDAALRNGKAG